MLEWDLTGPLAFCSGFEPNWFDEAVKKNLLLVLIAYFPGCSVLKNICTFCS